MEYRILKSSNTKMGIGLKNPILVGFCFRQAFLYHYKLPHTHTKGEIISIHTYQVADFSHSALTYISSLSSAFWA